MYTQAEFIARARQMVGVPYVLGAEWAPSCTAPCIPTALDCSELIEGLFRENGTPIGDLAAAQYDKTAPVSDVRTGDLVFLRNNSSRWNGIGHVAVITAPLANGDWEIIESRGRAYGTVRTTLSYWRTRAGFTGVRRFPAFNLASSSVVATPLTVVSGRTLLAEDGVLGPLTRKAIQRLIGTVADGVFGPNTRRALQRWLGVAADGVWGRQTIMALQKRIGTKVDGVWGPATTRAFQSYINRTAASAVAA